MWGRRGEGKQGKGNGKQTKKRERGDVRFGDEVFSPGRDENEIKETYSQTCYE